MARRSTKQEVRVKKMVDKIIEEAEQSSDPTDRIKAVKAWANYQTILLKVKGAKKDEEPGSGWSKFMRETTKKPRPDYPGT